MANVSHEELLTVERSARQEIKEASDRVSADIRRLEENVDGKTRRSRNEAIGAVFALGILGSVLAFFGITHYIELKVDDWMKNKVGTRIDDLISNLEAKSLHASTVTAAIDQAARSDWAIGCSNFVCLIVDGTGRKYMFDTNNGLSPAGIFPGLTSPIALSCDNNDRCVVVDAKGILFHGNVRDGKPYTGPILIQ